MKQFRIIIEETHKYKQDNLLVLVFKEGEDYGIDITNRTSSFGRVTIGSKEKVQYLFSVLNEFISEQADYFDACNCVSSILSYKTYEEMILLIHTYKRKVKKLEAYAIINMLGLYRRDEKTILGTHIIKIFRHRDDEIVGEFLSFDGSGEFMFHFF